MTATTHPHIIPLVRKFRTELREELAALEVRLDASISAKIAESNAQMRLAIVQSSRFNMLATAAFIAVGVAVIMLK